MKSKRAVIIQCRLSSTRLPKKALKMLGDKTVLEWCLLSMKKVNADYYYVATDEASFFELEPICKKNGYKCFSGDLNNVLKRFCDLINLLKVDTVIRATADNPFLFYEAAISSVEEFEKKNKNGLVCDYLTYTGLPHGSGVEVFSAQSLLKAATLTDSPYDKEHVGPSLYNHKDRFNCEFIRSPKRFYYPSLRTTIDTPVDYLKAICIVSYLSQSSKASAPYTTEQIIQALSSDYIKNPIMFMPSLQKGHGTGHLHRCLSLALKTKSFIYIPQDASLEQTSQIVLEYKEKGLQDYQIISKIEDEMYAKIIVTDCFKITEKENKIIKKFNSVIAIDESSSYCDDFDYILDIIPSIDTNKQTNLTDASYITKPKNKKTQISEKIENILICIGGEDPSNLTKSVLDITKSVFPGANIKAIGKNYDKPVSNLKETLYKYDLVITHYGLTAFEACSANCRVIMLSTTKLHQSLAQKYNYAYIPFNEITKENFQKALSSTYLFVKDRFSEQKDLSTLINNLAAGNRYCCPVCQKQNAKDKIISRNESRTYRRCKSCSLIYISWSCDKEKSYEKQYFFEDYKKQYGKTYKEDFASIKQSCDKRVNVIQKVGLKTKNKALLDIGCAYGPFLQASYEKGFCPFGTDICDDAIDYVKKQLNFPAVTSCFPNINTLQEFGHEKFDVVTMWYVIEHFKNLDEVLIKVNQILKKGGIFAFSTPSAQGISALSDKNHFFNISPTDHYSVWERTKANNILKKYGFVVEKTVSTGHHPERFPVIKKSGAKKGSFQWKLIEKISRAKKLGDTVEIYCRKIVDYEK